MNGFQTETASQNNVKFTKIKKMIAQFMWTPKWNIP